MISDNTVCRQYILISAKIKWKWKKIREADILAAAGRENP